MSGAYTAQQGLIPVPINLGAAVAAGTNETWAILKVPTDVPTVHIVSATLANGSSQTANATDFNVFELKNGSTVMGTINCATTNLTADTPAAFTMSTTVASRKMAAADTLTLVKTATLNGTAGATAIQAVLTLWVRVGSEDLGAT